LLCLVQHCPPLVADFRASIGEEVRVGVVPVEFSYKLPGSEPTMTSSGDSNGPPQPTDHSDGSDVRGIPGTYQPSNAQVKCIRNRAV